MMRPVPLPLFIAFVLAFSVGGGAPAGPCEVAVAVGERGDFADGSNRE
jgi:hypothetical protein